MLFLLHNHENHAVCAHDPLLAHQSCRMPLCAKYVLNCLPVVAHGLAEFRHKHNWVPKDFVSDCMLFVSRAKLEKLPIRIFAYLETIILGCKRPHGIGHGALTFKLPSASSPRGTPLATLSSSVLPSANGQRLLHSRASPEHHRSRMMPIVLPCIPTMPLPSCPPSLLIRNPTSKPMKVSVR